ncbi:hypothetical protein Z948_2889 [Sulfitobacter donghicola DSW-25 = KCTC 12864 = JCM 14565]|nr:hypothetical protein Z948_2889 [Sulfitobacter donghicola DSW-25 = KCTC 12864 = JCM 14565]
MYSGLNYRSIGRFVGATGAKLQCVTLGRKGGFWHNYMLFWGLTGLI